MITKLIESFNQYIEECRKELSIEDNSHIAIHRIITKSNIQKANVLHEIYVYFIKNKSKHILTVVSSPGSYGSSQEDNLFSELSKGLFSIINDTECFNSIVYGDYTESK